MTNAQIPRKVTNRFEAGQNSEAQPQCQLDQPRIDRRAADLPESSVIGIGIRVQKLSVVKDVECLGPKFDLQAVAIDGS